MELTHVLTNTRNHFVFKSLKQQAKTHTKTIEIRKDEKTIIMKNKRMNGRGEQKTTKNQPTNLTHIKPALTPKSCIVWCIQFVVEYNTSYTNECTVEESHQTYGAPFVK